jgi:hypothetical protein
MKDYEILRKRIEDEFLNIVEQGTTNVFGYEPPKGFAKIL